MEILQDQLIKQTWHSVSREEAESLLLKQPAWTFLFRKDHFALVLQEILRRGLKKTLRCYTLSYLDAEGIVRDKTVVFIDQKWMFYDDDPTLSSPSFLSLDGLIHDVARYPLISAGL